MMNGRFPSPQSDEIDSEASGWIVRTSEGTLSSEEQRAFDDWRIADPRHDRTLQAMQRTWSDIAELDGLADLVPAPNSTIGLAPPQLRIRRIRRMSVALAGSAAVAAIALFLVRDPLPEGGERYVTALAETHRVVLPDGSIVTLGAKSAITVRFSATERRVILTGGQAFFEVDHNAARPFLVEAGGSTVRDIGTKFDVNMSDGTVRVAVLEGRVQIVTRTGATRRIFRDVRAGERTEIGSALLAGLADPKIAAPVTVTPPSQMPGAWRGGRLVYDDVRLADLVADINRYYAPGVDLKTAAVGDMRITASFKTTEIPAFMHAIGATLPVRATETPQGAFEVTPDPLIRSDHE